MDVKITPAQRRMLQNAAAGRELTHGLVGRSAHGGASATCWVLYRRGWIDQTHKITPAGAEALRNG